MFTKLRKTIANLIYPDLVTIQLSYSQSLHDSIIYDFREFLKNRIQNELDLEKAKLKLSKDKWDASLRTLNRNGALEKIMSQTAEKFLNPPNERIHSPASTPKVKTPEEEVRAPFTNFPLHTCCSFLKMSFEQSGKIKDGVLVLGVELRNEVKHDLWQLLSSRNETDAKMNLSIFRNELADYDYNALGEIQLTDVEKKIITEIFNFKE